MKHQDQFVIPFSGLKAGSYQYDFNIDSAFFEHFGQSEIREASVTVACRMERQLRMLVFHFDIGGTVKVPCDRCLEEFDLPIAGQEQLIVKFGDEHGEESEDIFIITEDEHSIDLRPFLFDYINLLMPYKKVHPTDANGNSLCDPGVTRYISDDETPQTDPRWDALKNLKNDRNGN